VKFLRVLLRTIDFAAIIVAFIAFATAVASAVMVGLYNAAKFLFHGISDAWSNGSDRWLLIAVAVSAVWCWFRREALNTPGGKK
jgi:hypothetical protein